MYSLELYIRQLVVEGNIMDADRRLREITQTSIPTDWLQGAFAFISGNTRLEGLASSFIRLRKKGGARGRLDVPRGSLDEQRAQRGELEIRMLGLLRCTRIFFRNILQKPLVARFVCMILLPARFPTKWPFLERLFSARLLGYQTRQSRLSFERPYAVDGLLLGISDVAIIKTWGGLG